MSLKAIGLCYDTKHDLFFVSVVELGKDGRPTHNGYAFSLYQGLDITLRKLDLA